MFLMESHDENKINKYRPEGNSELETLGSSIRTTSCESDTMSTSTEGDSIVVADGATLKPQVAVNHKFRNPCQRYKHWCQLIESKVIADSRNGCLGSLFRKNEDPKLYSMSKLFSLEHHKPLDEHKGTAVQEVLLDMPRSGLVTSPSSLYPKDDDYSYKDPSCGMKVVEKVLLEFAALFPEVGYCQGANFLVKEIAIAMNFDFGRTLVIFTALVQRYGFDRILDRNISGYYIREYQFLTLLQEFFPKVKEKFEQLNFGPAMLYLGPLVNNLYCQDQTLDSQSKLDILDNFLETGWPYMMKVGLGIIGSLETLILEKTTDDQLLYLFKNLKGSLGTFNIASMGHKKQRREKLWKRLTKGNNVTQKQLNKLEKKYEARTLKTKISSPKDDFKYNNPSHRYHHWCQLIKAKEIADTSCLDCLPRKMEEDPNLYSLSKLFSLENEELVSTMDHKVVKQVLKDMPRSGTVTPTSSLYPEGGEDYKDPSVGMKVVEQVLLEFAELFPNTGYCQGANFIVKEIASSMNFDAGRTLVIFTALVQRYGFDRIFDNNMSGYHLCEFQFKNLLQEFFPAVTKKFEELEVNPVSYLGPLVMSLYFQDQALDSKSKLDILDNFLEGGWPYMMKVGLGLIASFEKEILEMSDGLDIALLFRDLNGTLGNCQIASLGHRKLKRAKFFQRLLNGNDVTVKQLIKLQNRYTTR